MRLLPVVLTVLLATACETTSDVVNHDSTGFDKTCTSVDECSLVFVGNVCGCSCELEAVSSSAFGDYQDSYFDAQADCTELLSCPVVCAEPTVTCDAGECGAF